MNPLPRCAEGILTILVVVKLFQSYAHSRWVTWCCYTGSCFQSPKTDNLFQTKIETNYSELLNVEDSVTKLLGCEPISFLMNCFNPISIKYLQFF